MYDETHQLQIALITKCGLHTRGSLFTLLYLSINISRCIQKPEWYTRKPGMYNETHQIQDYIDYKLRSLCSRFLVHFTVFGCQYQQTYLN